MNAMFLCHFYVSIHIIDGIGNWWIVEAKIPFSKSKYTFVSKIRGETGAQSSFT